MGKKEKYSVVDLFAGAGGFGLGFQLSNKFELICSVEKDQWACDTLRANHTHKIIQENIRSYSSDKIKKAVKISPDVIIGGPPCQGFSLAGPSKDPNDPRNSLFVDFARWVEVLSPSIFVMENVKGILYRKNENGTPVKDIIIEKFRSLGYQTEVWILNASDYGVPQNRERVFFVGNKFSINIIPPKKVDYKVTVGEAISDLPKIYAGGGKEEMKYTRKVKSDYQKWIRGNSDFVYNHVAMKHTQRLIERYKLIQQGTSMDSLPEEYKVLKRNGNGSFSSVHYQSNYRHLQHNKISYTIPASFYSNFIHPFEPRNITSREAARIQSFPDYYQFKGKRTQISKKLLARLGKQDEDFLSQYNQIGNAVPPLLAKVIAQSLIPYLDKLNSKPIIKTKSTRKRAIV